MSRVTIKDVANKAGVSISTVSRVLTGSAKVSGKVRQCVVEAVELLGYEPNMAAQMMKGMPLKSIGLIMPNVNSVMFPAAVRGIEDVATLEGYSLMLCNTEENHEREAYYVDDFIRRSIDGFIFMTATPNHTKIVELHEKNFPVVAYNRHLPGKTDAVVLDNYDSGYKVADYLISRGLKKIAYMGGWTRLHLYQQRLIGVQDRLREAGLSIDPGMLFKDLDATEDGYFTTMGMIKNGYRPDAIIAASDLKAVGVVKALQELKVSIPGDISVISFDNIDIAKWMTPALTTMAQPFYELGRIACRRLLQRINAKSELPVRTYEIKSELIVRDSVI